MQDYTSVDAFKKTIFDAYFKNDPIGFIDVGARGGSHSLVEPLHPFVSFLGFEPDPEECDLLNNNETLKQYWREFNILPHALGDAHGQKTLNILSAATNSSLLTPNPVFIDRYKMTEKWSITKKIPVELSPLDHVMYELSLGFKNSGEIIKLDTQGTEYEILVGAKKLLSEKTVCIVTEVEFFEIYAGQKLFSDVDVYLRELGFSFYGFLTLHTRSQKKLNKKTHIGKERLFYADAVFFKDPLSKAISLSDRQYRVLLCSAILTGFYDFALELITLSAMKLSNTELISIKEYIEQQAFVNPELTKTNLSSLVGKVANNSANVNVLLGKFIDEINFPDFEDCKA
ncbi:MAG: FkbM family methyltransferase [Pseudomonadota bacterium]